MSELMTVGVSERRFRRGEPTPLVALVGATCPLGRHLMKVLPLSGLQVIGLYRNRTALPGCWSDISEFHAQQFDLEQPAQLAEILQPATHILWLAQSANCWGMPDPNVAALQTVLSRARRCRSLVLVSSGGAVYGNPKVLPVAEEHPCHPISLYGCSKRQMEKTVLNYIQTNPAVSAVIIRPGNIYGQEYLSGEPKGCVAAFAHALLHDQAVPLVAHGTAVRDFIHADDVARAILMALDRRDGPAIWNVGSGCGTRVSHVLAMISDILHRNPKKFWDIDASATDIEEIFLDVRRIRRDALWEPTMSLHEGLKLMLRAS